MKLKEGDIFEFSINEKSTCYGQIVSTFKKDTITIIIFEGLYKSRPEIEELLEDKILFFGNTFDAKFHHKNWIVIASEKSNLKNIKLPYYKIGTDPVYIENFFEKNIRKVKSQKEEQQLTYRSFVAPIRFETALKAYYKIIEWNEAFDKLLYTNVIKSKELVES